MGKDSKSKLLTSTLKYLLTEVPRDKIKKIEESLLTNDDFSFPFQAGKTSGLPAAYNTSDEVFLEIGEAKTRSVLQSACSSPRPVFCVDSDVAKPGLGVAGLPLLRHPNPRKNWRNLPSALARYRASVRWMRRLGLVLDFIS